MKVSKLKQDDVEKAYDFLHQGQILRADRQGLAGRGSSKLVEALKTLGDMPAGLRGRDRLFLPGITQVAD